MTNKTSSPVIRQTSQKIRVALIDDDEAVLDALGIFLRRHGLEVASYSAARPFLDELSAGGTFDCVVTDVRMPDMSGLQLQNILNTHAHFLPLIVITGHGDIEMAVTTLKAGAADFIEKPTDDQRLLASIKTAVGRGRENQLSEAELCEFTKRYEQLSDRQRDVMGLAIQGLSNKEIAVRLGISPRTVEHYREWVMERMQANSFADLVHMAVRLKLPRSSR
jgi:two-component system, LuxR family, response regulator FixJ